MADEKITDNMALEAAALVAARHASTFGNIGNRSMFPPEPDASDWGEFSRVEQSHARFAARAVVEAYLKALEPNQVTEKQPLASGNKVDAMEVATAISLELKTQLGAAGKMQVGNGTFTEGLTDVAIEGRINLVMLAHYILDIVPRLVIGEGED